MGRKSPLLRRPSVFMATPRGRRRLRRQWRGFCAKRELRLLRFRSPEDESDSSYSLCVMRPCRGRAFQEEEKAIAQRGQRTRRKRSKWRGKKKAGNLMLPAG